MSFENLFQFREYTEYVDLKIAKIRLKLFVTSTTS